MAMVTETVTAETAKGIPGPELVLWPKQLEFVLAQEPTVTYQGGSGSGKSHAGAAKLLAFALGHPGSRGMAVGATYKSIQQGLLVAMAEVLSALPEKYRPSWHKVDQRFDWPNGSLTWVRSATDPDVIPGADLAYLWGDEVARWPERTYQECQGRIRQPGFPHQLWLTFTPKGRNWAFRRFGQPADGLRVIRTSSRENLALAEDFHERLIAAHGEGSAWWRQEALGEFVAFEGLIYPMFSEARHVTDADPPKLARVVAGVDWGWANPGCIIVLGLSATDVLWAVEEVHETDRALEWWVERARDLQRRWGIERFYCDPSEPANIDACFKAGIPAVKATNAVIPGIGFVAGRLNSDRLVIHSRCTATIDELALYAWKTRAGGEVRPDEPEKVHDHAMDALRYGTMGIDTPTVRLAAPGNYYQTTGAR